jgi:ribosomal protein S18 acetylase RimI-like enzyme
MSPLNNPVWFALQTGHADLAQGDDTIRAYPADIGPFAAMASDADRPSAPGLAQALRSHDLVYFIGQAPSLPSPWSVQSCPAILQMTCSRLPPSPSTTSVEVRELGDADVPAMLALTARVFPGYFRARTPAMGRYVGVFNGGELAAMGGERFRLEHHVEISAICTHPSFVGRGYARTIVRRLAESILDRRLTPFLHLSPDNVRARVLYNSVGFAERGEIRMAKAQGAVEAQ